MRTLKFIVSGSSIFLDPDCDFTNLVPGTESYLEAKFSFSPEWDGTTKVAGFYSNLGIEYQPQLIKRDNTCIIPIEALRKSIFKVRVVGQKNDYKICTNRVKVHQKGGKT